MMTELEHASPRVGRVRLDPARQPRGRDDVVVLEIVREGRFGLFKKDRVRPLLRPAAPKVEERSDG